MIKVPRFMCMIALTSAVMAGGLSQSSFAKTGNTEPKATYKFHSDPLLYLPPPPAAGSLQQAHDDQVFQTTRQLKGGPRWALATQDADTRLAAILNDYACAAGIKLEPGKLPLLAGVLKRALHTEYDDIGVTKNNWNRKRPFVGNDSPICTEKDREGLGKQGSYPSGHTTMGWTVALILAELMPDHAGSILQRGQIYGSSRIVCGAHWVSDVQAGYILASGEVAALHGDERFRHDLELAKKELDKARSSAGAPDDLQCKIEQAGR
ncbi:MAG: phosphatase PAP2 family protein [Zymomonas mobilis]|uniref:Acid phosphatase n=1 Tax=Zymomonas mobilis TaxID=542 RepID=A0A542VZB6_ZYMMB|nr:phosphatase PAP2 family protein [Zymomonas mobilis]TQL16665.1 acid phosphatase (class A) [Zymomonas mobilis]